MHDTVIGHEPVAPKRLTFFQNVSDQAFAIDFGQF